MGRRTHGKYTLPQLSGSVSPEGNIFGSKGQLYSKNDGTLWLKDSGNNTLTGWVQVSENGVVQITTTDFLDLVQNSQLTPGAIYEVTDVSGVEAIFIQALTSNTYFPETTVTMYLPDYTESGSYKGQYHATLGAVADGEIYTWGEWNWKNESGGALTPDLPDANTFDSADRFTQLTKSSSNNYTLCLLSAGIAIYSGQIILKSTTKTDVNAQMDNALPFFSGFGYSSVAQFNLPTANPTLNQNNGLRLTNNRIEYTVGGDNGGIFYNQCGQLPEGKIQDCYITGIAGNPTGVNFNDLFGSGAITNVVGNVRIQDNTIKGGTSAVYDITSTTGYIDVLHCHIQDNSHIFDITNSGAGKLYFWDCEFHENINVNGWNITGGSGKLVQFLDSYLNANVDLVDFTYTDNAIINFTDGQNFKIINATDVNFNNVKFMFPLAQPQVTWDFTGFTADIVNETIDEGMGAFTITHNFSTSPLASGSSVLYNFIPSGARLTNCTIIPNSITGGAGATLRVGMSVDDVSYGLAATAVGSITNTVVSTVSNPSTGNRSLQLTAGTNNITGGSVTIKVEFIL